MSATATNKAVDTKSQSVRDEELEEIKQLEAKYKVSLNLCMDGPTDVFITKKSRLKASPYLPTNLIAT